MIWAIAISYVLSRQCEYPSSRLHFISAILLSLDWHTKIFAAALQTTLHDMIGRKRTTPFIYIFVELSNAA